MSAVEQRVPWTDTPAVPHSSAPDADDGERPNLTDAGNAIRLRRLHGRDLRYCHVWKAWLYWDGRRWTPDTSGECVRRAKDAARSILAEARDETESAKRKELARWALTSESGTRIRNMLQLAESEPGIPVQPEDLDSDTTRLNVVNGTVDLRTGQLLAHQRADLITHLAGTEYDPHAECQVWMAVLRRVFNNNAALIEFLQRGVGYSLTGETREQVLFFLHGLGANGKTTVIETLRALLGDYAQQSTFATFLVKRGGDSGASNDIARLRGVRLATAVESDETGRLAEGVVKQITGGDTITARYLFAEYFEFRPQLKLWLSSNHKPRITGVDHAIWRRIRLIPFTQTIPAEERDPNLLAKLRTELPGILAWAVRGCLAWQQDGLGAPAEVMAATEQYREEMDVIGGFLAECCVEDPVALVPASELYDAYRKWGDSSGETVLSQTAFGRKLSDRGFTSVKHGSARSKHRSGLRLRNGQDGSGQFSQNLSPTLHPRGEDREKLSELSQPSRNGPGNGHPTHLELGGEA